MVGAGASRGGTRFSSGAMIRVRASRRTSRGWILHIEQMTPSLPDLGGRRARFAGAFLSRRSRPARAATGTARGSCLGDGLGLCMHDHVPHVRLALADVILKPACQVVGRWQRHIGSNAHADEHDKTAGAMQQTQLPRWRTGSVHDKSRDSPPLGLIRMVAVLVRTGCGWFLEWFQMGLYNLDTSLVTQLRLDPRQPRALVGSRRRAPS